MRSYPIGGIIDKIVFLQLPKLKNPIVKGIDFDSELVGSFLSQWDSIRETKCLLEYLYILKDKNFEHDDYLDLAENGIYDDNGSTLFFVDGYISIVTGEKESGKIDIEDIIKIVEYWETYIELIKDEDAVFYGGRFFYDIKTIDGIDFDHPA